MVGEGEEAGGLCCVKREFQDCGRWVVAAEVFERMASPYWPGSVVI